jgi:hypothetical protein
VTAKGTGGVWIEGEPPAATGGFGLGNLRVVVDHDQGLADRQPAAV